MSLSACADLVARGDPDRFDALRAAPSDMQSRMWPLLAFNLEVARAPWMTGEAMIAEMRLQWWRDVLDEIDAGKKPRAHEVAQPLHDLLAGQGAAIAHLDRLVAARRWDVWRDPFPNSAAMGAYLEDTSAGLLLGAARVMGWDDAHDAALRDAGYGFGLAAWLGAVPALRASGRAPLPKDADIGDLARSALDRLASARRALPGYMAPLLRMGWMAQPTLRRAAATPARVDQGALALSEFSKRGRLVVKSLSGGW